MSNTIQPFSQPNVPETSNGQSSVSAAPARNEEAAAQAESVTLSQTAQSGVQLLAAAQGASGIDESAVANIRAQLANGSYNVSPENLALAIATVLKETKP
jgi:flagellar biosynthesis anti-sigma factor FlgM